MLRRLFAALVPLALMLPAPAHAIVGGSPDADSHPYAGVVFLDSGLFGTRGSCSGTLVSPTVVLTAAHCTLLADDVVVAFAAQAADPAGEPTPGVTYHPGTAHPSPRWPANSGLLGTDDVGVVVLHHPVEGIEPARLPPAGYLDGRPKLKSAVYTLVGFGVHFVRSGGGPQRPQPVNDLVRRVTTATLASLKSELLTLQANPHDSHAGGGACFGDSGGPLLLDGYVIGVASQITSQFCAGGINVYQRTDTPASRSFLSGFPVAL